MATQPVNPKQLQSLIDLLKLFNEKVETLPENFAEDLIDNLKTSNKEIKKTNRELVQLNKKLLGLSTPETSNKEEANKDITSINSSIKEHSINITDAIKETNRILSNLSNIKNTSNIDTNIIKKAISETIKSVSKTTSTKAKADDTSIIVKSINKKLTSFDKVLTRVIESVNLKSIKRAKNKSTEVQEQIPENGINFNQNALNLTNAKIQKILAIDNFKDLSNQVSDEFKRFSNLESAIGDQIKTIEDKLLDPSLDKQEQEEALKEKVSLHKQYQQQLHLISDLISTTINRKMREMSKLDKYKDKNEAELRQLAMDELRSNQDENIKRMYNLLMSEKEKKSEVRQHINETVKQLENITGDIQTYHLDYNKILSNTVKNSVLNRKAMGALYDEFRQNSLKINEEQRRITYDIHSSEEERKKKLLLQIENEKQEEVRLQRIIDERRHQEDLIIQNKKLAEAKKYKQQELNKGPTDDIHSREYRQHMRKTEKHYQKILKETLIEKMSRVARDTRDKTRFIYETRRRKISNLNQTITSSSGGKYNLGSLVTMLTGTGNIISKLKPILDTAGTLFNMIKPFLTMANVLVSSLVALVVIGVLKTKAFWKILYGVFWILGKITGALYWVVSNVIMKMFDGFQIIGIFIENLFTSIWKALTKFDFSGFKAMFMGWFETYKAPFVILFDYIKNISVNIIDTIKDMFGKIISSITDSKLYKLLFSDDKKETVPTINKLNVEPSSLYENSDKEIKRLEENKKNLEDKKTQQKETQQNTQLSTDIMRQIADNIKQTNSLIEKQKQPVPTQPVPVPANITIDYNRPAIWQSV